MISAYNLNPGTPYTTPPAGGFGYQLSNIEYWTQQIFDPQRENELVNQLKTYLLFIIIELIKMLNHKSKIIPIKH